MDIGHWPFLKNGQWTLDLPFQGPTNDLISARQSGFRSKHSCETALTIMTDDWLDAMYNNEFCGVLFIDLCKAFDLVDHNLLLQKLKLYHVCEDSHLWFQSYLFLNKNKQ